MGLFGWHQCAEPGCETWLFIPLFAKPRVGDVIEESPEWTTYLAELSAWYEPHDASKTRCPKHHPHKAENLSPGLDAVSKPP